MHLFIFVQIAFAEHQNNIAKMDSVNEKCTGMKKMDWSDSLKGKLSMLMSYKNHVSAKCQLFMKWAKKLFSA